MVDHSPLWLRLVTACLTSTIVIFLIAPLLIVVGVSFTAGDYIAFPPQGLSLRWYANTLPC